MADLKKGDNQTERIEQELVRLEMELNTYYCEAGKIILEKAEQHERKINLLVDTIIETRRQLIISKNEIEGVNNESNSQSKPETKSNEFQQCTRIR